MRPVFAPEIPEYERRLIRGMPRPLVAADGAPPREPRWGGRATVEGFGTMFLAGALFGFLPIMWCCIVTWGSVTFGLLMEAVMIGIWVAFGFTAFVAVGSVMAAFLGIMIFIFFEEGDDARLAREHHGRYLSTADLPPGSPGHECMLRAQDAIDTITGSRVWDAEWLAGLMDEETLARHEWGIAEGLAVGSPDDLRVQRLEEVAERVRAADTAARDVESGELETDEVLQQRLGAVRTAVTVLASGDNNVPS